jgi:hypothetical protein
MKKYKLSIIVLSYNTKELLRGCLVSLEKNRREVDFEVIVPDNGSVDGSPEMVEKDFPNARLIESEINLGFAGGNNLAKELARGEYVLFLNSDTIVHKNTLRETVDYLDRYKDVGAVTCKIVLPNGDLDKDTRRSFITPWIGLVHLFLKLDRLFPKSRLFAKYWYGYMPENKIHEIDALQGAFFLTRKKLLDEIGWFDEDYFLDGEDIDISWRIKDMGFKNMYFPKVEITHFKGSSKGKIESQNRKLVPLKDRFRYRMAGVNSMEIFYRKHLWSRYPFVLNLFVISGIKVIKAARFIRTILLG